MDPNGQQGNISTTSSAPVSLATSSATGQQPGSDQPASNGINSQPQPSTVSGHAQRTPQMPSPYRSTTNLTSAPSNVARLAAQPNPSVYSPAVASIDDQEPETKQISIWDVLKSWQWESFAALLAIGVLVCEIILLVHYDNKFLVLHWSHSWKINSVFAFLTTILEGSVMFYVAASMGQLRWHWYRKKHHRLDWLEIMTDASRPSGAMRLLFRKGAQRQFAVIGALLVIFLLGVNTFTQQVITQEIEPFQLGFSTGIVPINTNYTWRDTDTTIQIGTQQPTPNMVAAIQNGFYSFSNQGEKSLSVSAWTYCEGDSCDFGEYQSIGVCSQCEDVSQDVKNPCPSGNCTDGDYYTLSNGVDLSLLATYGILNLTADANLTTSSALADVAGPLIVRFHALIANEIEANRTGQGATALQCAAWWCVKTYRGSTVNGTLREDIVDIYTDTSPSARTQYGQTNDIILNPPQCIVNDTTPSNSSFCTYTASAFSQVALQNFLAAPNGSLFPPFLTGSTTYQGHGEGTTFNYTSPLAGGLISTTTARSAVGHEIRSGFNKMADQMTVDIRGALAEDGSSEYSYGSASFREQKFHVRWGWIAYPAAIALVSLIFFIVTIIMTRKDEAWKASVLPVIFHSFGGADRDEFVRLESVADMKKASRGRKVFLGGEKGGHLAFKADKSVSVSGRAYEVTQNTAGGIGTIADISGQAS